MRFIKPLVKIPAHLGNGERNDVSDELQP